MGFTITAPSAFSFNGDVTQLKLDAPVTPTPLTTVANTAAPLLAADNTATNGRKIYSINNKSATETVYVALGREASTSDYDYPIYPKGVIGDFEYSGDSISVICAGVAAVSITYAKYLEV